MQNRFPAHSVSFVFLLLAGVWGSLSAQPAPPPLLCVDDVDCVETAPPPGGSEGRGAEGTYTLASIGNVPFAYSTPTPPTITSEATVTPATIGANKVNGRRLILTAGNYGDQSFSTQDQEIVLTTGVVIQLLTVGYSARRLRFTASPIRSGTIGYMHVSYAGMEGVPAQDITSGLAQDITFDGVLQDHIEREGPNPAQQNYIYGTRLAILNSSLRARDFAIYSHGANDVIIANSFLHGAGPAAGGSGASQAAVRFHVVNRLIFVDNRVLNEPFEGNDQRHTFRIHSGNVGLGDTDNCYVARNQLEGPGTAITPQGSEAPASAIGTVWYENNSHYTTGFLNLMQAINPTQWPQVLILRDNIAYGSLPNNWPPQHTSGWIVTNNSVLSSQAPPVWNFK